VAANAGLLPGLRSDDYVVPIRWDSFTSVPSDADSLRAREILSNAVLYGLNGWWNTRMSYPEQKGEYLDFGRNKEKRFQKQVREPAGMASALATCLALGAYDAKKTGVSEPAARARTLRLIRSVAYCHKANSSGDKTWGHHHHPFDTNNICILAGVAGWLMWPHLDTEGRQLLRKMVESEAGYSLATDALYYRDKAGGILSPGNTRGEEMAWRAALFFLATSMMPAHGSFSDWINKGIEYALAAMARPSDVNSSKVYHGRRLSQWLNGSNVHENGTVVNHKIDPHPHYTVSMIMSNYCAAAWYTLAGLPTPEAFRFNADKVYQALVQLHFSPKNGYRPPGGTIYIPDSPEIYFPSGNDKGSNEYIKYGLADANVRHFGGDELVSESRRGGYWEKLHVQKALEMQMRGRDGSSNRTEEEGGVDREWWIAYHAGRLYLAKWVAAQDRFATTDQVFTSSPRQP